MNNIDKLSESINTFSNTIIKLGDNFSSVQEEITNFFILGDLPRIFSKQKSKLKAYKRSRRNNESIKIMKHGRQQKTRIKRK